MVDVVVIDVEDVLYFSENPDHQKIICYGKLEAINKQICHQYDLKYPCNLHVLVPDDGEYKCRIKIPQIMQTDWKAKMRRSSVDNNYYFYSSNSALRKLSKNAKHTTTAVLVVSDYDKTIRNESASDRDIVSVLEQTVKLLFDALMEYKRLTNILDPRIEDQAATLSDFRERLLSTAYGFRDDMLGLIELLNCYKWRIDFYLEHFPNKCQVPDAITAKQVLLKALEQYDARISSVKPIYNQDVVKYLQRHGKGSKEIITSRKLETESDAEKYRLLMMQKQLQKSDYDRLPERVFFTSAAECQLRVNGEFYMAKKAICIVVKLLCDARYSGYKAMTGIVELIDDNPDELSPSLIRTMQNYLDMSGFKLTLLPSRRYYQDVVAEEEEQLNHTFPIAMLVNCIVGQQKKYDTSEVTHQVWTEAWSELQVRYDAAKHHAQLMRRRALFRPVAALPCAVKRSRVEDTSVDNGNTKKHITTKRLTLSGFGGNASAFSHINAMVARASASVSEGDKSTYSPTSI